MDVAYTRIQEKITELKELLKELQTIMPTRYETYRSNKLFKAASERYLEKIVEQITQIDSLFQKQEGILRKEESFLNLYEHKIIPKELYIALREIKGLRNILIHQYEQINDEIVYEAIKSKLTKDAESFIRLMKKFYEKN